MPHYNRGRPHSRLGPGIPEPEAPSITELRLPGHQLQIKDDRLDWKTFARRYEAEMARPDNRRVLDALAAFSHHTNFSVGCYCEDERRCHRGVLKQILKKHGATVSGREYR